MRNSEAYPYRSGSKPILEVTAALWRDFSSVLNPFGSTAAQIEPCDDISHQILVLTIQPWVPANVVRAVYANLQKLGLKGKPRALSERNLAVFRFVISHQEVVPGDGAQPALRKPPWRILLDRWNKVYPKEHEWHYTDVRRFRRDFDRAEQAVVHPRIDFFG